MFNLIGMNIEDALKLGFRIRVTSINGIRLNVDKKYIRNRRNVHVYNGIIVREVDRG